MAKKAPISIGDRVQLTSKFLQCTGQYTGKEPASVWTVTGLTNGDRWAIVDEPVHDLSIFTADELASDPTLAYRRIAVGNLQCTTRKVR